MATPIPSPERPATPARAPGPWRRAAAAIDRTPTVTLLAVLVAAHVALHARWLAMPPAGFHLWRQTMTLSVARNFHEEGFDLLRPRVDSRGATPGITGMEFPLVNAAIGAAYRVVGFGDGLHRVVMLLLSLPALLGMMRLARALLGTQTAGFLAGALLVTNPLFTYYAVSALPEVPMLGALLLGLADLVLWSRSLRTSCGVRGLALLTLAGLVKLSSAAAWPAVLLVLADGARRATVRQRLVVGAAAAVGLAIVAGWYVWARHLSAVYGNQDFLLSPIFPFRRALVPVVLRRVFVRWLPEVYVSYPQFVLVLIGVVALWRTGGPAGHVLAAWTAGLVVYGASMGPHLIMHDYYMAPATPMLLLVATVGLERVAAAAETGRAPAWLAGALVVAMVIVGPYRGISRLVGGKRGRDLAGLEARLQPFMPERDALVVAASDPSPSIYLYFMHRKGWPVTDRVRPDDFAAMVRDGARYLVSDSRGLERRADVAPHLRFVGSSGRFFVFAIT